MSVSGPTTTLQALLNQIQAPARPTASPRVAAPTTAAPAAATRHVAQAPAAGAVQNGAATPNPNAPRGTYLNIVV